MTFNLWYRLSEFLYQVDDVDFDQLRNVFKPFVERLDILLFVESLSPLPSLQFSVIWRNYTSIVVWIRTWKALSIRTRKFPNFAQKLWKASRMWRLWSDRWNCSKMYAFLFLLVTLFDKQINKHECNFRWSRICLQTRRAVGSRRSRHFLSFPASFITSSSGFFCGYSATFLLVFRTEEEYVPQLLNLVFTFTVNDHPMLLKTATNLLGNLQLWLQVHHEYMGMCGTRKSNENCFL